MKTRRKLFFIIKLLPAIGAIFSIFANWDKAYPTVLKLFLPIGNIDLFKPLFQYSYLFKITSIVFSIVAILLVGNFFRKFLRGDKFSYWKFFAVSTITIISFMLNDALKQDTLIIGLILYMAVTVFVTFVGINITRFSYYSLKE